MTREQLALRLLIFGFEGKEPTPFLRDMLRRGLGGVILFRRNVEGPRQVAALSNSLGRLAAPGVRFLLSIDQEGGRVARLREGFSSIPTMRRLGESQDPNLCRAVGRIVGAELRAVGINYDLAPVLDVDTNPKNPVIGDRAFSRDPGEVARLGLSFAEGLLEAGVLPCGKHFPGHGDTLQDSHKTLPRITRSLDELRQIELFPFAEAARRGLASIMTAHVLYPALDDVLPATLSPRILRRLLREELGYTGVVISDDLEMAAIAERFDLAEAARLALLAGNDLLLVCHREDRQEAVLRALADCERSLLEAAVARVEAMTQKIAPWAPVDEEAAVSRTGQPSALLDGLRAAPAGPDPTEVS
jgi:beta-N-acetylhexosaminidase